MSEELPPLKEYPFPLNFTTAMITVYQGTFEKTKQKKNKKKTSKGTVQDNMNDQDRHPSFKIFFES